MKNVSVTWCSKRNFSPLWLKWKDTSALWHLLERVSFCIFDSVLKLISFETDLTLLEMFLFARTFGVRPSSFGHSAGTQNWKLHECGEDAMQKDAWRPMFENFKAYSQSLITGWVRRQRNRLPNGFLVEVGRHQSKHTRNESYALCCYGSCILSLKAS